MMDRMESLSHTKGKFKYHEVFIPKYRRNQLYGDLRRYLGEAFLPMNTSNRLVSSTNPLELNSTDWLPLIAIIRFLRERNCIS